MVRIKTAASTAAAIGVLLTACGRSNTALMDDGLKQDLAKVSGSSIELAPNSAGSQMVVSAIEGGPTAAPARALTKKPIAPKPAVRPPQRPTESVAQIPTATPAPIVTAPRPVEPSITEPAPLPPTQAPVVRPQSRRQTGPYKTEAEIFRQMPWIRP